MGYMVNWDHTRCQHCRGPLLAHQIARNPQGTHQCNTCMDLARDYARCLVERGKAHRFTRIARSRYAARKHPEA